MNSSSSNSAGSAAPAPPPPPVELFLVLPDGSCIPTTPKTRRIVMRQVRSEARKQAKIRRHEKAVELHIAIEDRAAARRLERELAELHRGSIRWAARFRVRAEPKPSETRTSPVTKRIVGPSRTRPAPTPGAARPASSWVVDTMGMKGVIWQQSYLGRKSPGFHPGKARENWEYIVRDEAVLLDADGEPVIISNIGDDWVEIGAAWQAIEDASTRANAKIQILAIAPFDSDMSEAEMIAALRHFCRTVLDPLDLPYSAAIHAPPAAGDQRNFHPHIAFSLRPMRRVEPYCWEVADDVCGELDGRDGVQMLRHLWAHSMSEAAEQARSNRRYTGLGYGARLLDLETGEHLGEARAAIVARGGHVWAHERNRIKAERNAARRMICDCDRKIAALTAVRDAALARIGRGDKVVPVRIIRAATPARTAAVMEIATAPVPATVMTPSTQVRTAAVIEAARSPMPARPVKVPSARPTLNSVVKSAPPVVPARVRSTTTSPVRPAKRRAPARAVTSVARHHTTMPSAAVVVRKAAHPVRPAALLSMSTTAPSLARTFPLAPRARPAVEISTTRPVTMTTGVNHAAALLDLLALARVARRKKRKAIARDEAPRLDTLPALDAIPSLASLPVLQHLVTAPESRSPTDPDPSAAEDQARLARLVALDAYVADYGGKEGQLETDYPVLKALGVGWGWLQAPGVRSALWTMRDEQQRVIAGLAREATARPLSFAKSGPRFWPRDLPAADLRRLDRWSADPGFQHDMFAIEQGIAAAHAARDAGRNTGVQRPDPDRSSAASAIDVPDGFGGRRHGPAPVFHDEASGVRVAAFDPATGKPTDQLLMLLMLAGRHPDRVVLASDGRLMAQPGKPAMLAPLLHPWRHDEQVTALVTETVRASRSAGQPVWPPSVVAAVQAFAGRGDDRSRTAGGAPPPDRGPSR